MRGVRINTLQNETARPLGSIFARRTRTHTQNSSRTHIVPPTLVLNFSWGKNYRTFTKIIFHYQNLISTKKLLSNRQISRYLTSWFGQEREFFHTSEEIEIFWQIVHRVNRSGTYYIAFRRITGLNSSSFVTSMSLSILAKFEVSEVWTNYVEESIWYLSEIDPWDILLLFKQQCSRKLVPID